MKAQMNRRFAAYDRAYDLERRWNDVVLEPALQRAVEGAFIETKHGWILDALPTPPRDADLGDATGWQAVATKFHVDDLIAGEPPHPDGLRHLLEQSVAAGQRLAGRLAVLGPHRVLLSVDPDWPTATLRFFQRRADEPWGSDDLEAYTLEAVYVIDT